MASTPAALSRKIYNARIGEFMQRRTRGIREYVSRGQFRYVFTSYTNV